MSGPSTELKKNYASPEIIQALYDEDVESALRLFQEQPALVNAIILPEHDPSSEKISEEQPLLYYAATIGCRRRHASLVAQITYNVTYPEPRKPASADSIAITTAMVDLDANFSRMSLQPRTYERDEWQHGCLASITEIQDSPEILELLIRAGATANYTDLRNPRSDGLASAIRNNAPKSFNFLLDSKINNGTLDDEGVADVLFAIVGQGSLTFWDFMTARGLIPLKDAVVSPRWKRYIYGQADGPDVKHLDLLLAHATLEQHRERTHPSPEQGSLVIRLATLGGNPDAAGAAGMTCLACACVWAAGEVIEALASKADMNTTVPLFETPLGYCWVWERLVLHDEPGSYLHVASFLGNSSAVKCFVQNGAKLTLTENGRTPLHWLALTGPTDESLDPREWKFKCFDESYAESYRRVISTLMDAGLDIDMPDKYGKTALHYACQANTGELIPILLQLGASTKLYDHNGRLAVHYLGQRFSDRDWSPNDDEGHYLDSFTPTVVQSFTMDQLNTGDREGSTLLMHAVKAYNLGTVNWLIRLGVDVMRRDNRGRTCLHYAMIRPNPVYITENPDYVRFKWKAADKILETMQQLLISRGVDVATVDNEGKTAADIYDEEQLWILPARKAKEVEFAKQREEARRRGYGRGWTPRPNRT